LQSRSQAALNRYRYRISKCWTPLWFTGPAAYTSVAPSPSTPRWPHDPSAVAFSLWSLDVAPQAGFRGRW